jgi:hypothetical protein
MVHEKVNKIVDFLLERYKGGEEYFDNLDAEIRKEENKDIIIELFKGLENKSVIVSGKFGSHVLEMYKKGEVKCSGFMFVNGGLRYGKVARASVRGIFQSEAVFIDDSFYKGRTRDRINEFLTTKVGYKSKVVETRVVYDGSIDKDWSVGSFFRYHK